MKVFFLSLISLSTICTGLSQNSKSWKGYFSYNQINDLSQSDTRVIAATENAIFSKDMVSGTVKTINTIDGLSGLTITAIYHNQTLKKTIIGYENGLIIIYNEVNGSMLNVVDIINKSIPQNIKKVNHFMDYNGIIYVSCDFGIVQYNLNTMQFGDTYFIGPNGAQINISQTAVFNGRIYASSRTDGIKSADITNANLNDFNQWTNVAGFGWSGIEKLGNNLLAVSTTGSLQKWQGSSFTPVTQLPEPATDIRSSGIYLVVTTKNHVYIYNDALSQISDVSSNQIPDMAVEFTCATIINNTVFIGTKEDGIFSKGLTDSFFQNNTPDGPLRNNVFAITTGTNSLWAVYGGYDIDYNPYSFSDTGLSQYGISKFTKNGWLNIPYESVLGAKALSRVTINPKNEKQVFVSSFHSGLLKIENDAVTTLFDDTNTGANGLQPIATSPDDIWINGTAFDNTGNLWVTNSMVTKGIKVLKSNGQWMSYDMQGVYANLAKLRFGRLVIDKNGTKWMATWRDGIIGFNEAFNNRFKVISGSAEGGNLPSTDARAVAVDNRNQLWIGTLNGLRVLPSVDSFFYNDALRANAIIIIEENLAQELLYEQSITDIFVDGANNKWIGTVDAGVFYVSSDGQKTIYHFSTDNSPLPSNNINDIDVNGVTGEVFFATTKGMVSFKGTSTTANSDLSNVYVYPNPVRPEFSGTVKISGLMDKVHVKITDIEGNLVHEVISEGGTTEWDTTAFGKYKVASGVYMVFVSSEDGAETTVKKVMIVR